MSRDLIERAKERLHKWRHSTAYGASLTVPLREYRAVLDRIAALEAEASEGDRRGLERAAEVANVIAGNYDVSAMAEDLEDWEVFQRREGGHASRKVAEAIRALIPEALAREGWQPISSAPTNRAIQIHVPSLDYYGNGGVFAGMLVDMGTGRRWMTFGWAIGRDLGHENTPTHWRPLPPPPSQDREPDSQRGAK